MNKNEDFLLYYRSRISYVIIISAQYGGGQNFQE